MKLPTVLQHWVGCDADELPEPDRAPHAELERIYREQMQGHLIEAFCSSVSSSKNRCRVATLRPGAAHTTPPVPWSATYAPRSRGVDQGESSEQVMTDPVITAPACPSPLRWDRACLREGVARRHGRRRNLGRTTPRNSLRTPTNRPRHNPTQIHRTTRA